MNRLYFLSPFSSRSVVGEQLAKLPQSLLQLPELPLRRSVRSPAQDFRKTQPMIVPLAVRPVRLGIVIGDKALMGKLRPLPTRYLLEMHLTHAPHHVEMGFDEIFPSTGPRGALVIVTARSCKPSVARFRTVCMK